MIGGFVSCHNGDSGIISKAGKNGEPISRVRSEDEGMNRAIDSAKKILSGFFKEFFRQ